MMRLLSLFLVVFLLFPVQADDKEKAATISPWLYKKLTNTEGLIGQKKYKQAEQKLIAVLVDVDKKSYEQATVLRSLSSVYALEGRYGKAADSLAKAVALHVFLPAQQQQAFLSLGQLYMAVEQYSKAVKILEPWLVKNTKGTVQINVLVANAYTQLKRYRKALPFIKRAIADTKKPEESWYQLNLALYYEVEDYASASRILKKLIRIYPDNKDYWYQLSSTYQQIRQYKKAVSVQYLAYKKGFITSEKELLALANLYLYINSPYKAAKLMKLEIANKRIKSNAKNWETLANAWTVAKEFEKAITALKTASTLNDKGRLYQKLGQIYVEQEKWGEAVTFLNKAVTKGGLKNTGTSYIMLGMSYYELEKLSLAKKAFNRALQYSKTKKTARQWLAYI